jgi:hypothetical protein
MRSDGRPERRERPAERRGEGRVTATTAARLAADYVAEMTDREPEAIVGLERYDDGHWQVDVEIVEVRRIPDSTDVLATYRARLDADGELMACQRTRRYKRCQTGEG